MKIKRDNLRNDMHVVTHGLLSIVLVAVVVVSASADPLPGRDVLKFSQKPLDGLTITDAAGITEVYYGHDEFSTAYGETNAAGQLPVVYRGRFMADDFADGFDSPVVHVKWWGSYLNQSIIPNFSVDRFLITFETDIPADPDDPTSFSRPGTPLLNQVVRRVPAGALAPGSGTFTEEFVSPGGAPLDESLYMYNAELHLGKEFPEKSDEVYWLKIVALVDLPPGVPAPDPNQPPPTDLPQWGWHNRDYSVMNPLASTAPAVVPGEVDLGPLPGTGVPVWHFQDDAVTGLVAIDTGLNQIMPEVFQDPATFQPTHYLGGGIDGPGGPPPNEGIARFSQDLAFELYTIPEPGTCMLMLLGLGAVLMRQRRV